MKLQKAAQKLNLKIVTGDLSRTIASAYVSDLLSDVLANAEEGDLWITLQIHPNIVAVASMKDISAIVLVNSRQPEEETIAKAEEEDLPILISEQPAFELAGELYKLLEAE